MGWDKSPVEFVQVISKDLAEKRTQIATETLQAVISGSPVRNGAYRSNHCVSVNSADYGFDMTLGKGADNEPPKGSLNVEAYTAGLEIIAAESGEPYASITIQNNLPYAERLENGYSEQAPIGVYGPAFAGIRAKYSKS
ncbi:hypothetical protein QP097_07555 [Oligella urethralis]|uniref:hypothetical protein n=1 Tax=Oligella urethralis TaxID=90245 RepID=UPI002549C891|nr:hypothetical protein [Oligella urethralis]MDK6203314.1 hypothetical protein [Oligella urethralis]